MISYDHCDSHAPGGVLLSSRGVDNSTHLLLETGSYRAHKHVSVMHIRHKYTNDILANFHK